MRMRIGLLWLVLCVAVSPALAQNLSPQQRQAILDYQLTLTNAEHLITAMQAMTRYVVSLPDYQELLRKSATMTTADRIAQIEADPKAAAILKQNNLTARDYLIGVPTLRMALMAAQGVTTPNIVASPGNVAFAKANLAQLKPKMDAADGLSR